MQSVFLKRTVPPGLRPVLKRLHMRVIGGIGRISGRPLVQTRLAFKTYGRPDLHSFFGYFDIAPFDANDRLALAHRVQRKAHPKRDDVEVGYYDLATGEYHHLGQSALWCWQMGSRLRWLPDGNVCWNDMYDSKTYGCVIADVRGNILQRLPVSLYDVDRDGRFGLSLNFSRLQRLRPGYGYERLDDSTKGDRCPASAGIEIVDLKTGGSSQLVSLQSIATLAPQPTMQHAIHYLNHLSFSPDGSLFCVFHLWQAEDGKRRMRHLVFGRDGQLQSHIPGQEHVSHFDWFEDAQALVAFARLPGDERAKYQKVDAKTGAASDFSHTAIYTDGHPSIRPGRDHVLVSDTYPDRASFRQLYLYDTGTGKRTEVAAFYSPPSLFGERRCDLHPRWSHDGGYVAVDSAHSGVRSLVVLDLRQDLEGA